MHKLQRSKLCEGEQFDDEAKERLICEEDENFDHSVPSRNRRHRRWGIVWAVLNGLLFILSMLVLVVSRRSPTVSAPLLANGALRETSVYSPIFDHVNIRLTDTIMNGSVLRPADTPWNGEPTNVDKEAMWKDFDFIRTIPITRAQLLQMGKDPSISAKFAHSDWQMGEDIYIGGLDIFHQIHCLNRLRKAALGVKGISSSEPGPSREHNMHCIDMLMQHLLCTGDTGFLTYNWYKGMPDPQPNFSVQRKCKDITQLQQYRDTFAVPRDKWDAYRKPADAVELEPDDHVQSGAEAVDREADRDLIMSTAGA